MKVLKRLSLGMVTFMLIIMANSITANAYWKQNNKGWQYTNGDYYSIGWNIIDGNWYYFDDEGIMETGWINDDEKWYYLNDSGYLDDSKTTTIMPDEMKIIYNIVSIYNDSGIIKYENKGYINEIGLNDTSLYKFSSEDGLGNEFSEYYYDPFNGNVYKLKQGILTLLNTNTVINNSNIQITIIEAVEKVKDYLLMNGKYVPDRIEYDHENVNSYIIHCYDSTDKYIKIDGWYYVDKFTGNVTHMY